MKSKKTIIIVGASIPKSPKFLLTLFVKLLIVTLFFSSYSNLCAQTLTDYDGDTRGDFVFIFPTSNKKINLTSFASLKRFNPMTIKNYNNTSLIYENSRFLTGNFDTDATTDYALVYRYNQSKTGIFLLPSYNKFKPKRIFYSANFSSDKSTFIAGNFDTDSITDFVVIYNYRNSQIGIFILSSKKNYQPKRVYLETKKHWNFKRSVFVAGDFDGDKIDEVGALYSYIDNSLGVFIFRSDKFYQPVRYYRSPANRWNFLKTQFSVGDFNNDGKDEFIALAENKKRKLSIYLLYRSNNYKPRLVSETNFNWEINASSFTVNNYNIDEKDELGAYLKTEQGFYKLYSFAHPQFKAELLNKVSIEKNSYCLLSPGNEAQPLPRNRFDFSLPQKCNLKNLKPGDVDLIVIKGATASRGQTISIYGKNGKMIGSSLCSTGRRFSTPLGNFWVIYKKDVLISRNFLLYCIKPVYFKKKYAIHGWPRSRYTHRLLNYYLLGQPASLGCIRTTEEFATAIWKGSLAYKTRVKILP